MVSCSVLGCKSRTERQITGITFHSFPIIPETRLKWVEATGRINWQPTKNSKICSIHFSDQSFNYKNKVVLLQKYSVPIKHIHGDVPKPLEPQPGPSQASPYYEVQVKEEVFDDEDSNDAMVMSCSPEPEVTYTKQEFTNNTLLQSNQKPDPEIKRLEVIVRQQQATIKKKNELIKKLRAENRGYKKQVEDMEVLVNSLKEQIAVKSENIVVNIYE